VFTISAVGYFLCVLTCKTLRTYQEPPHHRARSPHRAKSSLCSGQGYVDAPSAGEDGREYVISPAFIAAADNGATVRAPELAALNGNEYWDSMDEELHVWLCLCCNWFVQESLGRPLFGADSHIDPDGILFRTPLQYDDVGPASCVDPICSTVRPKGVAHKTSWRDVRSIKHYGTLWPTNFTRTLHIFPSVERSSFFRGISAKSSQWSETTTNMPPCAHRQPNKRLVQSGMAYIHVATFLFKGPILLVPIFVILMTRKCYRRDYQIID